MLVVMRPDATPEDVEGVSEKIRTLGFTPHPMASPQRTAIGITGNEGQIAPEVFDLLPGVDRAISVSQPFKLVSTEMKSEPTVVDVDGVKVGGHNVVVMGGPCSVESEEQILRCAEVVQASGGTFLRGGAFKPRTSPYAFRGLMEEGLRLLAMARERTGLKIVTEVLTVDTVDLVAEYADVLQIGARNMQNFALLEAAGSQSKAVLLKRGMSATIKELLMAAEYIAAKGNYKIMLCERGIRTFEPMTRNTLDLGAVAMLKELTHLPVIVDPSHGIGVRSGVTPLARAGIAVGADGLIVEMHPDPSQAWSDGMQSLTIPMFQSMMEQVKKISAAVDRGI
ncbi:MAG: 3-deoxy-7-phosphoheptulonate synthase [Myxococcota bacterium]|nr:3-deoxy-7-phosphoheptulonate synthase [Myxococcota bacterium]